MPRKDKEKKTKFQLSQMFVNEPKIEMSGNREIIVDGCKGVVEYSEDLIKLNLGEVVLTLSGDGLVINSFDSSIAVIFFESIISHDTAKIIFQIVWFCWRNSIPYTKIRIIYTFKCIFLVAKDINRNFFA